MELYEHTNEKEQFFLYIQNLQDQIVAGLEAVDGQAKFKEDWERPEGGGGRTRVIENGKVLKRRCEYSAVHGNCQKPCKKMFGVGEADFFACGLSLVYTLRILWCLQFMPIGVILKCTMSGKIIQQWFGGGQDLTPYYLFEEDARHFHQTCKTACDKHNPEFYPNIKAM
jgi:coproporphyrinogen III oxidase